MNLRKKIKLWVVGLASAAIPLVTEANCIPGGGFTFYRDDDEDCCYTDVYYDDYYYDDYYYYDDCYFDC